jgi:uncharacterized repeat protein (TIGR03803 family)
MHSTRVCSAVVAVSSTFLTFLLSLSLVTQPTQAQTLQVLYNFAGSSDGGKPDAGLVRDAARNLYGTATSNGAFGWGVAFKVDSSGTETVLHSFGDGTKDGRTPYADLIRDQAGNLYGTTYEGGGIGCTDGCGTVFKIDNAGKETVLHRFAGGTADGCFPYGGLIRDLAGNLYGTTQECGASNFGTVFKLNKTGKETTLYSFAGGATDGEYPTYTTLLMDAGGTLYGVTQQGGTTGGGVVYKLTQKGKETVLYSFLGGTADGCYVLGTPFMDKNGNIYGTAGQCGASGVGTVWKLTKRGKETVLHSFAGGTSDGEYPFAGVIVDGAGNVYGNTKFGGASGFGTVYRVTKNGKETLLHSFDGTDGQYPNGSLAKNPKGTVLFSTTQNGGTMGFGTVWKITK